MTKFVKMSLAAAVAVAGISTTASAAMMDDLSVSGKVYVETIVKTSDVSGTSGDGNSVSEQDIDFDVTFEKKISDNLTAVVGFEADTSVEDDASKTGDDVTHTGAPNLEVPDAHFVYANAGAAVTVGRQAINTPTTDGEVGEGAIATYTMGGITVAAANYPNNDIADNTDARAMAVLGKVGPVSFQAWNVDVESTNTNNTIVVGTAVAGWNIELRNAVTDYDAAGTKDGSTNKLVVSGKVANVGLTAIALTTDKDGAAYVTDASSANTAELVNFKANGLTDATVFALVASMPVSEKGKVTVSYGTADFDNTTTANNVTTNVSSSDSASEYVLQYTHSLAKSTSMSVRYAGYSEDIENVETDKTHARVDLTYKF